MSKLHEEYERTYCDCGKCQAACRNMPGVLVPGDLDRIAHYIGVEPDAEFIRNNFEASDAATTTCRAPVLRVPTIVPAQKENGHCIFLTAKGKCAIHPVAPFGCTRFNVCDGPDNAREAANRCAGAEKAVTESLDYTLLWKWLRMQGKAARTVVERQRALETAIGE